MKEQQHLMHVLGGLLKIPRIESALKEARLELEEGRRDYCRSPGENERGSGKDMRSGQM